MSVNAKNVLADDFVTVRCRVVQLDRESEKLPICVRNEVGDEWWPKLDTIIDHEQRELRVNDRIRHTTTGDVGTIAVIVDDYAAWKPDIGYLITSPLAYLRRAEG